MREIFDQEARFNSEAKFRRIWVGFTSGKCGIYSVCPSLFEISGNINDRSGRKKIMNETFFTKNVLLQLEIVISYNFKLEKNLLKEKKYVKS